MASDTEILAEVARALNGSIVVDDALHAVLQAVGDHFGLTTAWVWVSQPAGGFRLGAARGLPEGLRASPGWTEGECWCQKQFNRGELTPGEVGLIQCSRLQALERGADGFRYHASIALEADGERLGIMNLASRDWRELEDAELRLLNAVSDMLAVALGRARLYERSVEVGVLQERARVSREMHDGVAQTLTALVLGLEAMDTEQPGVKRALQLARSGLVDTRAAVAGLRDSPFVGPLASEMRGIVEEAEQRGLSVALQSDVRGEPPSRLRHAACRILQEALANVWSHSGTSHCAVQLHGDERALRLVVADDGVGLSPDDADGYGLRGMRERAHLVGGRLTLSADEGTVVEFEWKA